jgi:hypothetical protein
MNTLLASFPAIGAGVFAARAASALLLGGRGGAGAPVAAAYGPRSKSPAPAAPARSRQAGQAGDGV